MAQSTMSTSQFSKDGKYFAQIATDGKVKIWETATSTFKQEFTPNLHLTTPCTCLQWIQSNVQSPRKKRKRLQTETSSADSSSNYFVALGTSSGSLLLYSFSSAQIDLTIDSNTSHSISCVTSEQNKVYAGAEQFVLLFDLKEKAVKTKWKTGNDKINSILIVPNKSRLLTASRSIHLWDTNSKEIVKTFTGHSSDVFILNYIPTNTDSYFVSASKADRLLNCWNLNEDQQDKKSVASLLMEDTAESISLTQSENTTNLAAVTRSGNAHIYQITLNGKCAKPVKPQVTIQVAAETKNVVTPIAIVSAYFHRDATVMVAHGSQLFLTFENIVPNFSEKIQCLIRKDPREVLISRESEIKKTRQPVIDGNVDYLSPHTTEKYRFKRKSSGVRSEVPMEERLENLTLNKLSSGVPRQDNLANLLVQGLHSKDKSILQNVLCKRDENIIKNTIKRLPMQVVIPLLSELSLLVQGKTLASQIGLIWMKNLVQHHASQLLANPELIEKIQPILASVENRLSLSTPLLRLRGRLDLLVTQISDSNKKDSEADEALIVFKDNEDSDEDSEDNIELNLHSESENEWVEEENSEMEEDIIDANNISDSEMSV